MFNTTFRFFFVGVFIFTALGQPLPLFAQIQETPDITELSLIDDNPKEETDSDIQPSIDQPLPDEIPPELIDEILPELIQEPKKSDLEELAAPTFFISAS
jgi:hypothetical protein